MVLTLNQKKEAEASQPAEMSGSVTPDQDWKQTLETQFANIMVNNEKPIGDQELQIIFTLCPLYSPGSLVESQLVLEPTTILESRVGGKWTALQELLLTIKATVDNARGGVFAQVVFANTGTLLAAAPTDADKAALLKHEEMYKQEVGAFLSENEIPYEFSSFIDRGVSFPQFINPSTPIPYDYGKDESGNIDKNKYIEAINQCLAEMRIPHKIENVNKKKREVIKNLISIFGEEPAFWLVTSYLAFDYQIADIVGPNGLYISVERLEALFRIAYLTDSLKVLMRADLKA